MPLPQVEAAVEDLKNANRELLAVVDSLTDADWDRYVPYGEWTVKDLVAHAIGDMSPSGPGLIAAGVLTPEFIAETSKGFDVRARNQSMVEERRRLTRADLRQMLFHAYDAFIAAALRLDETHLPVLEYPVPMGPEYQIKVLDWLWHGYHSRQHADDIRRALKIDYQPEKLEFIPELGEKLRANIRAHEGFLRAAYSIADDAWGEEAPDCPGWTYHDILAHIASNEVRREARLRSALAEASDEELAAINDVDGWNATSVAERRDRSLRELADELAGGWRRILKTLARFKPEDLAKPIILGNDARIPGAEFIDRMAIHTSRHAGQLVPGSRARRTPGPS